MTGIQFITDAKGRKTAAAIDLKKHSELWQDIQGCVGLPVAAARKTNTARKSEGGLDRKRKTA